ncbi:MAG: single-stranded DNA-binding protein [Clostridia bacterium]|nr:single-stranded DNA-binding protein [Clostridia bacterium]
MNKIFLLGRLTKDSETRVIKNSDTLVEKLSIAVDRKYTKRGEEQQTDFFNVVAFDKTGEFIKKYFSKGQQIVIIGRVQNRSWEDDNGERHHITEVIAEEAYFADTKKNKTADASILNGTITPELPKVDENAVIASSDDDLPF